MTDLLDHPALRLPGDVPKLLRRGSPLPGGVVVRTDVPRDDAGRPCAMVARDVAASQGAIHREPLCDLRLDLTDATGRTHAVWWVAGWEGLHAPDSARATLLTSDRFRITTLPPGGVRAGSPPMSMHDRRFCPATTSGERHIARRRGMDIWREIPALRGLSTHRHQALPDGSRAVDAVALGLVVLHLVGRLEGP